MSIIDAILLRTAYIAAHLRAKSDEPPSTKTRSLPPRATLHSHPGERQETICAHTFGPEWPWPEPPV